MGRKLCSMSNIVTIVLIVTLCSREVTGNLYRFEINHGAHKHWFKEKRVQRAVKYAGSLDNLIGKPGEGYYMEVEIGTPKQTLNALIDTGSSNFAVACDSSLNVMKYFKMNESSTFENTGKTLSVPYTEGSWKGILGQDYVTFTSLPDTTVKANIACITSEHNFFINGSNWHGILGLGFAKIARPDSSVEPVFDVMVRQGQLEDWFSVELCGIGALSPEGTINGSVVFGSTDPSLYTGDLYSTPIIKEWYYEVVITDIQVNGHSLGMDCKEYNFDRTIVDTGTTNLRLPDRVFNNLVQQFKQHLNMSARRGLPPEEFWTGMEVLCFDEDAVPYDDFPSLTITLPVNDTYALDLVVSAQQYLRYLKDEKATPRERCFKFGISSISEGPVIGAVILEGYHVVFDRQERKVKFGVTKCPSADSSSRISTVVGRQWSGGDYRDCAYKSPEDSTIPVFRTIVYVFVGICAICVFPLLCLIQQQYCRKRCPTYRRTRTESESPVTENMEDGDT